MGINLPKKISHFSKEKNPTLIFVGRLIKAKGIEDAIEVCSILEKEIPNIKLRIIGRGEYKYERKLKALISELNISKNVDFKGFVTQEKKFELLSRSHILLNPSAKEGFGLTIPEAGIVKTPSVAYNVEGIRDIIIDKKNGILVDPSPLQMAEEVKNLLLNKKLYSILQKGAYVFAKNLNWNVTASEALREIDK